MTCYFNDNLNHESELNSFIKGFFCRNDLDQQDNIFISEKLGLDEGTSICDKLLNIDICYICKFISNCKTSFDIKPSNIPQYSDFNDGTINICEVLENAGNSGFRFNEIGEFLTQRGKTKIAYLKYGENHSKLAEQLGLVHIRNSDKFKKVYLSELGFNFNQYSFEVKGEILRRLSLKLPIIQSILTDAKENNISVIDYLDCLSISTQNRRLSNVFKIIRLIHNGENSKKYCYKNIEMR